MVRFSGKNVDIDVLVLFQELERSPTLLCNAGKASMVDISGKTATVRVAVAEGFVLLGPDAFAKVKDNNVKKGDVLAGRWLVVGISQQKLSQHTSPGNIAHASGPNSCQDHHLSAIPIDTAHIALPRVDCTFFFLSSHDSG